MTWDDQRRAVNSNEEDLQQTQNPLARNVNRMLTYEWFIKDSGFVPYPPPQIESTLKRPLCLNVCKST